MDFQQQVIEKSYQKPVLVDFWAEWCGPCKILGPVLDELANEQADLWELVKVDIDQHQQLASRYGIRSIPDVRLFYKGDMVAQFSGARSRHQVAEWLREHLPDDRKQELLALQQAMQDFPADTLPKLEAFVRNHQDLVDARVLLAKHLVFGQAQRARELVHDIKLSDAHSEKAEDIRTLAELMELPRQDDPVGTALHEAQEFAKSQQFGLLAEALIRAVGIDKTYADDLPRRASIALFRLLGNEHEVTKNFRWKFDMALY